MFGLIHIGSVFTNFLIYIFAGNRDLQSLILEEDLFQILVGSLIKVDTVNLVLPFSTHVSDRVDLVILPSSLLSFACW